MNMQNRTADKINIIVKEESHTMYLGAEAQILEGATKRQEATQIMVWDSIG